MSASVEIAGYRVMSGSKPLLKDRTEIPKVMGDIKIIDRAIVVMVTIKIAERSLMVSPRKAMLNVDAVSPKIMPLSSVNVMIA